MKKFHHRQHNASLTVSTSDGELDANFIATMLVVAELAHKCCEKGMNWDATRILILKNWERTK